MNSMKIGCHLSVAQGYLHMGKEAISIDANTFQFFTRNPRGWKTKELNIQDMEDLISLMKTNGFSPILAHAPYTLNPCAADERVHEFALMVMKAHFQRTIWSGLIICSVMTSMACLPRNPRG